MFKESYNKNIETVENYIENYFNNALSHLEENLTAPLKYSVLNGGKRIRGILTIEIAKMLGGDVDNALPFAMAIEFIHAYSLVHDDLPCMDDDDFRRGMPSCHKKFGEAMGVLCGDSLLNLAYEVMLDSILKGTLGANKAAKAVAEFSGIFGMIRGQVIDISLVNKENVTLKDLELLIDNKTCALIKAATLSGAYVSPHSDEDIKKVSEYAYHLGMAFQIRDDFEDEDEDKEGDGTPNFINLLGRDEAHKKLIYHKCEAEKILAKYNNNEFLLGLNEFLFGKF
ncbi:MAG: polyprenyl synthetase family protein [Ruminococcaceae bacterium]|nr:polyprenyl synthetase family protein [Oscillospiraceae bacterium]